MELTSHEQKILDIVNNHPEIMNNPEKRTQIAELYGLSEKTLRNRIAELKKRGLITSSNSNKESFKPELLNSKGELNLSALWNIILMKKWFILKSSIGVSILGIIYALVAPVYFSSMISMYPAGDLGSGGGSLGEFQGLAKTFGIGGLGPAPSYNIPDIVNSRRLKKNIVLKKWETVQYPDGIDLIQFWELDEPKLFSLRTWLLKLVKNNSFDTDTIKVLTNEAIIELDNLIKTNEEVSGLITISVLMQEPQLAADIANYISEFVKDFISIEQHREAVRNKNFILRQMKDAKVQLEISEDELTIFRKNNPSSHETPRSKMMRSRLESGVDENRAVYITLRQQFEIAKIDEAKENLHINILDIAEPAVKKAKPKRTLIVIMSFIVGIIASIPYVVYAHTNEEEA